MGRALVHVIQAGIAAGTLNAFQHAFKLADEYHVSVSSDHRFFTPTLTLSGYVRLVVVQRYRIDFEVAVLANLLRAYDH